MSHVKKMMLIPSLTPTMQPTALNPITMETPEKALTRHYINELDAEMEAILQNKSLNKGEKLKMYSQILQRYLNY